MKLPEIVTREWIAQNYAFAAVEWNSYYEGFIVTFETKEYHNGEVPGIDLAAQLLRMEHTYRPSQFGTPLHFLSKEQAFEFCRACGVEPYYGQVVYHQSGDFFLLVDGQRA